MTSVEDIKQAITQLPPEALHELRAWYEQFDAQLWDKPIEADVATGRLNDLAEEALQAVRNNQATEL